MAFRVSLTARAERDLEDIFVASRAEESDAAFAWYVGLRKAILRLEDNPHRCPATPENRRLRQLLYGKGRYVYRVIYRVVEAEREVVILHVRHGARDRASDLE